MRLRLFRLCILGALALLSVGCGRVQYLRYVSGVQFDPAESRGLPLDQVYVDNAVTKLKGGRLAVQFENPTRTIYRSESKIGKRLEQGEAWERLRTWFELGYLVELRNTKVFRQVERSGAVVANFEPDAVLKIAITEWHEGNKWTRALLGLGLGRTRVQTEGVLTDARTGKVLFAFADARIHPGGPSALGFPPKVWRGDDLIADDIGYQTRGVAKTLQIVITEP